MQGYMRVRMVQMLSMNAVLCDAVMRVALLSLA